MNRENLENTVGKRVKCLLTTVSSFFPTKVVKALFFRVGFSERVKDKCSRFSHICRLQMDESKILGHEFDKHS